MAQYGRDQSSTGPNPSRDSSSTPTPGLPPRMRFLRSEPVTEPLPIADALKRTPYRDPNVMGGPDDDTEQQKALDIAARVGELLLRCGASTRDVEASVLAVAASAGLRRLEVDITNQSLLLQSPSTNGRQPLTMLRVVRSSTRDFSRLMAVHQFVESLVSGGLDLDEATKKLKRIQRMPRLYPRWLVSVAFGGLAASVATILGGGWMAVAVAFVSAVLVDRVGRRLSNAGVPAFYGAAAGGLISTALAWFAYMSHQSRVVGEFVAHNLPGTMSTADFAYAISGGIVALLPGRQMASAVEDAVTGYPVTASGRVLTVILDCAGITVGVGAGLALTLNLDRALDLSLQSPGSLRFDMPPTVLLLQVACGAIGAACAAVTMRSRVRMLLPTAAAGALGVVGVALLTRYVGIGATTATAVAAVSVGFSARLVALRLGAPALVIVMPAVSPLLPGLRIFRGMYESVSGSVIGATKVAQSGVGVTTMLGAVGVALAISTGLVLGDVLSAPLDKPLVRRRRARRR